MRGVPPVYTDLVARSQKLRVLDDLPASGRGYSCYEVLDDAGGRLQHLAGLFQEVYAADPPDTAGG